MFLLSILAIIVANQSQTAENFDCRFTKPTLANINFSDVEKLLIGLGAEKIEGSGSRVAFVMPNNLKWEAHRPHPNKEAKKYKVEAVREFLEKLGYKDE